MEEEQTDRPVLSVEDMQQEKDGRIAEKVLEINAQRSPARSELQERKFELATGPVNKRRGHSSDAVTGHRRLASACAELHTSILWTKRWQGGALSVRAGTTVEPLPCSNLLAPCGYIISPHPRPDHFAHLAVLAVSEAMMLSQSRKFERCRCGITIDVKT